MLLDNNSCSSIVCTIPIANYNFYLCFQIGYLKTNEATYYIEPVKDYGPNELGHHLHIIHNSENDAKKSKKNCGTKNWSLGWAKAFQNYFKIPEKIKRSPHSSLHRYLEVLVVADKKFLEYHRDKDYENYILTIMNMVIW